MHCTTSYLSSPTLTVRFECEEDMDVALDVFFFDFTNIMSTGKRLLATGCQFKASRSDSCWRSNILRRGV
jgi:hypothetical protein